MGRHTSRRATRRGGGCPALKTWALSWSRSLGGRTAIRRREGTCKVVASAPNTMPAASGAARSRDESGEIVAASGSAALAVPRLGAASSNTKGQSNTLYWHHKNMHIKKQLVNYSIGRAYNFEALSVLTMR